MEERSLHQMLSDYTKPQLEDIVDILGKPGHGGRSKAKLVDDLDSYLHGEPRRWLSFLTERDLRQLRELVHAGPDKVKVQAWSDYPSLLEAIGIVHSDDSEEDCHKVWIDREVYEIVRGDVDEVFRVLERNGKFEWERMGLGYLNLYGAIPTDRLLLLLADWYADTHPDGLRPAVFLRAVCQSPWFKLNRYEDEHGDYLISPCVSDPADLLERRDAAASRSAYPFFSYDRVYEAGSGAPYFTVGLRTAEGMRLETLYRRLGYTGFEVTLALHDTWVEAQYTDGKDHDLLGPLMDSPRAAGLDQDSWEACCQMVADYANTVPKWIFAGSSARETEKGLVDWKAWKEGETQEREDYSLGLAVPHVAPDELCPCGSGLRYCRCHGRFLS